MRERIKTRTRFLVRSLRSPRAVLASLAGNSLVWRGMPDLLETNLLRLLDLLRENLPLVTAAITGAAAIDIALLGLGFEWLLFAYLIHRLIPRLLPTDEPAGAVIDTRGFKLLVILLILTLAQPIAAAVPVAFAPGFPTPIDSTGSALVLFLVWGLLGWTAVSSYVYVRWWGTATAATRLEFVDQLTGFSLDAERRAAELDHLDRDDWVGWTSNVLLLVGSGGSVMIICFLFGMVAGFASMMFPLAEVVILVGTVASGLAVRLPGERSGGILTALRDRTGDLEVRFYTVLQYATVSRKGTFLIIFVIFGVIASTLLTFVSLIGLFAFVWITFQSLTQPAASASVPIRMWNAFGYLLCLATPGLYSLWFWIRETYRIPHFLVYWETANPGSAAIQNDEELPRLVTRPPYYLLPVTVLWIPVAAMLLLGGPTVGDSLLFALGWPLLLGGVLWTVRWTLRTEPQPPRTDRRALPIVALVQLAWLVIIDRIVPEGFSFPPAAAITMAVLLFLLYYLPDVRVRLEHASRVPDEYAFPLVLGIGGGVFIVLTLLAVVFGSSLPAFMTDVFLAAGLVVLAMAVAGHVLTRLADGS